MSNLNLHADGSAENEQVALLHSFAEASQVGTKILKAVVPEHAPLDALRAAKGLLFTAESSFGLGIASIHKGSAMLIVQLEAKVGAPTKWSPPVFFSIGSGGLGFSLGSSTSEALTLLYTRAAIEELFGSKFDVTTRSVSQSGASGTAPVSHIIPETKDSSAKHAAKAVLDIDRHVDEVTKRAKTEKFSVTQGKVHDFTLQAEFYKKSRATSRKLYGRDSEFDEILLGGKIAPPADLQPLYAALSELVPTVSKENSAAVLLVDLKPDGEDLGAHGGPRDITG